MTYRNAPATHRLERRRFPLGLLLLAGLAAVNILATLLSLAAGSLSVLLW